MNNCSFCGKKIPWYGGKVIEGFVACVDCYKKYWEKIENHQLKKIKKIIGDKN